jgi:hypothetical protein
MWFSSSESARTYYGLHQLVLFRSYPSTYSLQAKFPSPTHNWKQILSKQLRKQNLLYYGKSEIRCWTAPKTTNEGHFHAEIDCTCFLSSDFMLHVPPVLTCAQGMYQRLKKKNNYYWQCSVATATQCLVLWRKKNTQTKPTQTHLRHKIYATHKTCLLIWRKRNAMS